MPVGDSEAGGCPAAATHSSRGLENSFSFASSLRESALLSLHFSRWGSMFLTLGKGKQQVIDGNKCECDCPKKQ